jgi:hypothetical protein
METKRPLQCDGVVDGGRCPKSATHLLCNREYVEGARPLAVPECDCLDDVMRGFQVGYDARGVLLVDGCFCDEHAAHALRHYPILKEVW